MLQPKRVKHRKQQKGRMKGLSQRGHTRYMKREGQGWIRIFPDKPVTSKPAEVRMGKGKGALDHWVAVVRAGRIMFELDGVPQAVAEEALRLAAQKMPVRCKFVVRPDYVETKTLK